jgi:hypothetical protein
VFNFASFESLFSFVNRKQDVARNGKNVLRADRSKSIYNVPSYLHSCACTKRNGIRENPQEKPKTREREQRKIVTEALPEAHRHTLRSKTIWFNVSLLRGKKGTRLATHLKMSVSTNVWCCDHVKINLRKITTKTMYSKYNTN